MKKSLSLVFALLLLTACTNENTKTENTKGSSTTVTSTVKESSNNSINEKNILSTNTTTTSTADRKSSQTEEEQSHTEDPASLSSFVGGWVFRKVVISFSLILMEKCLDLASQTESFRVLIF